MSQQSKLRDVDFSAILLEKLDPAQNVPGQGFRCKSREFVTYWKQGRILREVKASLCQCWIIRYEDNLAGYRTLLADTLEIDTQLLEGEGVRYCTFPAVKIGLLAADQRAKVLVVLD